MSSPGSCDSSVAILWSVSPSTGWTISSGSVGSDEGFPSDPTSWTSGSYNINFNFSVAGSYEVKMVIGNGCGSDTMTRYICVVAPPDAAFTLPTHTGCTPLRVPITNTSVIVPSCSVVRYNWLITKIRSTCIADSLTDYFYYSGTSSTSFAPSIQFNNEGSYTIRLQATNICRTVLSRLDTVIVKRKPEANIVVPDSICFGQTIAPTISGLKSCGDSILSYSWLFSGGSPASSSLATPGSVSYSTTGPKTITLSVVNSCGSVTRTKTIYVIAPPSANAGRDSFFCSGGSYQLGVPSITGNTYSWSPSTGLSSASISNPILTLINSDTIPHVYSYVLTVSNTLRCVSYDTVFITVNPIPRIVVRPSPAVICAGSSVLLTASGANTYTWSPSTGLSATTGAVVSANPSITTVYTIIGRITSTGCIGSAIDSVKVNPIPIVTPSATQTICSGTNSTSITHSSSTPGSIFSWSTSSIGVSGVIPISGTGVIPAFTLVNIGTTRGTVIITVIDTANGCASIPIYDTIYVNPTPIATASIPNQVICSGDTTAVVRFTSSVLGTTYTWTGTAPIGVSGYLTSGSTDSISRQVIINTNSTNAVVTYTITPRANGCNGASITYYDTIRPAPITTFSTTTQTICSGNTSAAVTLNSSTPGVVFSWTSTPPLGTSGVITSGTSTIPAQTIYDSTYFPVTINYIARATTSGGVGCPGTLATYSIIVNPRPDVMASRLRDTICSNTYTNIRLSSHVSPTSYSWTVISPAGVAGATSGSDSVISQLLINSTSSPLTVVYTITPSSRGCTGIPITVTIVVNPTPNVIFSSANQTICSGDFTSIVTINSTTPGSIISWNLDSITGISGALLTGLNTIPPQRIYSSLTSTTVLNYIASISYDGCAGISDTYQITITPRPHINALDRVQTICTEDSTRNIILSSDVIGTSYSWYAVSGPLITGFISSGSGNVIPAQALFNASATKDTLRYIVQPSYNGCSGDSLECIIIVLPRPSIMAIPDTQELCSGSATIPIRITSTIRGTNLSWNASATDISGYIASGTSDTIPSQVLTNTSIIASQGVVDYSIYPVAAGCPGDTAHATILLNTIPIPNFMPSAFDGCSPLTLGFATNTLLLGTIDSIIFDWGDTTSNLTMYPRIIAPIWPAVNHTFYNNTTSPITYNITLHVYNGCGDTFITRSILVRPNNVEAFFTTNGVNSGCEPFTLNFTDLSSGAATTSWCFDYHAYNDSCAPGTSIIATSGSTISHTYNAGTYNVRIYVTDGCSFDTFSQLINVYSRPVADFIFIDSLCSSSLVTFNNTSVPSVGSVLTSQNWYFGDGDSSNSISPSHIYVNGGSYNVCLIVYSSLGCSDTICKNIFINKRPEISIVSNNTCFNQQPIRLFGVSVPPDTTFSLRYNWSLGDGNTSTTANPIYSYTSSGTYGLILIATDGICIDTAYSSVEIYPKVDAAFTLSDSILCDAPQTISVTNNSVGAVNYSWDFGNGDSSFLIAPIYTFLTAGTYQIQLIAESSNRCLDTAYKMIEIVPRPIINNIDIIPAEGCQPLLVDFHPDVLNASTYVWNFGDGTLPFTTSSINQSNLYNDTGIFSVVLYAYANPTCMDSLVLQDTIIVHENPISDFSYITGEAIGSNGGPIIFTNLSQGAIAYSWDFGDGAFSNEVDPIHRFIASSNIEIFLIAENIFGCKDTSSQILCRNCGELFVPNAFAPDFGAGSDLVRIWKPAGYGLQSYLAQVFNTYGELLWSSDKLVLTQPAEGWDGTYQGIAMPQDVYVWKIDAVFIDGSRWKGMLYKDSKVPKTIGDVTLIR
jgi:PKD repeat protein